MVAVLSVIALLLGLYTTIQAISESRAEPPSLVAEFDAGKALTVHEFFKEHEGKIVDVQIRVIPSQLDDGSTREGDFGWRPDWRSFPTDRRASIDISAPLEPGPGRDANDVANVLEVIQVSETPLEVGVVYFPVDTTGGWEIKGRFRVDRVFTQMQQYISVITPQKPE